MDTNVIHGFCVSASVPLIARKCYCLRVLLTLRICVHFRMPSYIAPPLSVMPTLMATTCLGFSAMLNQLVEHIVLFIYLFYFVLFFKFYNNRMNMQLMKLNDCTKNCSLLLWVSIKQVHRAWKTNKNTETIQEQVRERERERERERLTKFLLLLTLWHTAYCSAYCSALLCSRTTHAKLLTCYGYLMAGYEDLSQISVSADTGGFFFPLLSVYASCSVSISYNIHFAFIN